MLTQMHTESMYKPNMLGYHRVKNKIDMANDSLKFMHLPSKNAIYIKI